MVMMSDGGRERSRGVEEKKRGTEATTDHDGGVEAEKEGKAAGDGNGVIEVIGGESGAAEEEEGSGAARGETEGVERRTGGVDAVEKKVVVTGDVIGAEEMEQMMIVTGEVRPERKEAKTETVGGCGGEAETSEMAVVAGRAETDDGEGERGRWRRKSSTVELT